VWLFAAFAMVMSGILLMVVPMMVGGLFDSVSSGLVDSSTGVEVPQ
jgi:hypothetical protein